MRESRSPLKPILAGLAATLVQIALAVGLLAPEGRLGDRYATLVQYDSYWFANIVDRGYQTTVPPIDHKVMEVSNVAFFPAYPVLAAALHYGLGFKTGNALLVTAQAAAWGFWSYFFLFCERWGLSPGFQICGALLILTHPTAFFLVAGYSESLFLMALLGFIYWNNSHAPKAKVWAALHGIVMSATRIVGIPCAMYPLVQSLIRTGWKSFRHPVTWLKSHFGAIGLTLVSMLGAGFFFVYCQFRWGHWDMYIRTQFAAWAIEPDYLAVFRPSNYHWLIPALDNPTEASQTAMTIGGLLFLIIGVCELIPAVRRRANGSARLGIYFCAAITYYLSVSGVASVEMESMLRYEFCVHALFVLAFMHFLGQFRLLPVPVRALGTVAVVLSSAAGLSIQGWYLWNFTRGNWIA